MTDPIRLDGVDRRMIAKAREVAALKTADAMRERYGDADSEMARAAALGEAQLLLLELAAVIERLGAAEVIVRAWCKGCEHATASAPCPRCGGPACAGCGRCPPCDGDLPDKEE